MRSLRLLPLTMLMAFLLLGLKVGEVMRDGRMLLLSFSQAGAQETAKPAEGAKEAEKPAADAKLAEGEAAKKEEGAKPAEGAKEEGAKKDEEPKVNPPATSPDEAATEEEAPKHEFSQVEIDLLQSLAKRRQEIDDWAKQIQIKENMLIATEQRINGKIDALQKVKKQVEDLLAQYNQQEDTKIRSLVKIYENMKPKDAARIFEELDMPVLLMVVDRMSERKVSPVLAAMSPTKAKDVTVQLAEQRKLQKSKGTISGLPQDNAAPAADASNPSAPDSGTAVPAASPPADNTAAAPAAATSAATPAAAAPATR